MVAINMKKYKIKTKELHDQIYTSVKILNFCNKGTWNKY